MALPSAYSTGSVDATPIGGPFKSSAGNYYLVTDDNSSSQSFNIYKASNPEGTWTCLTGTGQTLTSTLLKMDCKQFGDEIAILHYGTDAIRWAAFDMSSDTFTVSPASIASISNPATGSGSTVGIAKRSDGSYVAFYQGNNVTVMGTARNRVYMGIRSTGGSWTVGTAIDAGGAVDYKAGNCYLGSSDRVHMVWTSDGALKLYQRAVSSSDVLQTETTLSITGAGGAYTAGVSFNNSGTTRIAGWSFPDFWYFDSGNTPALNAGTGASSSFASFPGTIAADGTDLYFGCANNSFDIDIYKSTDNGATWSTVSTPHYAGNVSSGLKNSRTVSVYTRGSNNVFPYAFRDGTSGWYNEYTISSAGSSGSAQGAGTASGVGSATTNAAGSAQGAGTASATGAATTAAAGSAQGVGTASAVGQGAINAAGTAQGVGTASATGAATANGVGSAQGIGTASATGISTAASAGSAQGSGTASGVGSALGIGAGAAQGAGTASAVGQGAFNAAGAAQGVGTASATGAATTNAAGTAQGVGTAAGVGAATTNAAGAAQGAGTASGVGASTAAGAGSAQGVGTASGVGSTAAQSDGAGSAQGVGTAAGVGAATTNAAGSALGAGVASGVGAAQTNAVGAAQGAGTAAGVGRALFDAAGSAQGVGTAAATGAATTSAAGSAQGVGAASGVGASTAAGAGTAQGVGTASAVGSAASAGAGDGFAQGVGTATAVGASIASADGLAQATGTASGFSPVVVVDNPTSPYGGGGGRLSGGRGGAKIRRITEDEVREAYEIAMGIRPAATEQPVPKQMRSAVRAAVRRHALEEALAPRKVLQPDEIDWAGVLADIAAVEAFRAVIARIERDEEDAILALLFAA